MGLENIARRTLMENAIYITAINAYRKKTFHDSSIEIITIHFYFLNNCQNSFSYVSQKHIASTISVKKIVDYNKYAQKRDHFKFLEGFQHSEVSS